MNWTGLLNWSLNYADGTHQSEFRPMDEETKNWLKEALESLVVDDNQILKKSSEILATLEDGSEENRKAKEEAAELLLGPIENLDVSLNFVKMDGFQHVIRCMIGSQYLKVKKTCASVFASCVQNNPPVQKYAVDHHAVEGLTALIKEENDLSFKEQLVTCLSSLVRGKFAEGREKFRQLEGVQLVYSLLLERSSLRIVKKCLLMVSDLLYQTRSVGDESLSLSMTESGLFDVVREIAREGDQEIKEMTEMIVFNSCSDLKE
jgi:hypothetical protein